MSADTIPLRKDVPAGDKWDLTVLYTNNEQWEADLKKLPELTEKVLAFKGHLADGPEKLLEALKTLEAADHAIEKVYHYASLMHEADQGDGPAQEMEKRAMMAYTQYVTAIASGNRNCSPFRTTRFRPGSRIRTLTTTVFTYRRRST